VKENAYVYIKDNIIFKALPSIKYLEAINSMLNDRYPELSSNSNRTIIVRIIKDTTMNLSKHNVDIITFGYWNKEKCINIINKMKSNLSKCSEDKDITMNLSERSEDKELISGVLTKDITMNLLKCSGNKELIYETLVEDITENLK
jgi:hypothetical protein